MCDLTQFIVSSLTTDINASTLAQLFMSDVVLSFGMFSVVVIDHGTTFNNVFISMCEKLNVNFWCRGNHRGKSFEYYHRFLNKTQVIAGNDRGTTSVIIKNAKTSQCTWNRAPIGNTDIPRSLAAIGWDFRFLLDVELRPTPNLKNVHNSALFQCFRNFSVESSFATSVLKLLIEYRRDAHRNRHNRDKSISDLKVGDVVKAHVQVNSVASKGVVSKFSYRDKGPFTITADLGNNSFEVQQYDDLSSSKQNY